MQLAHPLMGNVLAGGCFDLLHPAHRILKMSKEKEKYSFILLESDDNIKKLKGEDDQ